MASFTLHGIPVSQGIAIGRAHLLLDPAREVPRYLIAQEQVESEIDRLKEAIATVRQEFAVIRADLPRDVPAEMAAFLDVHELILSDSMLQDDVFALIRQHYYNAEWALATQVDALCEQFESIEDTYLRERKADVRQVGERVLKALSGAMSLLRTVQAHQDSSSLIVVAHDISPADMMQFRGNTFGGFVTNLGGQNSHTAIMARSLGIPAVLGAYSAAMLVEQDDVLIVDSVAGVVIVNPAPVVLAQYRQRLEVLHDMRRKLEGLRTTPAVTRDGQPITLHANIELPEDCTAAVAAGAVGVGLFRSEFLFMGRGAGNLPSEEEQLASYRQAVETMAGRPVTIRTLDVGADKPLNDQADILNPALGLRAIRYCLAEPGMFMTQLRAILRASAYGPVKLMVPMMAHAFEIDQTLALIHRAKEQLREEKIPFDEAMPVGAMIEVPAAALALPMFINRLDFLSIGTNDLIQYALAIDRADYEVAYLYDALHPAILFLVSHVISQANKAGIPVSVCGEMAGDTRMTKLLLGMGLRAFSMHPSQLLMLKGEILSSDCAACEAPVRKILRATEPSDIAAGMVKLARTGGGRVKETGTS